MTRAIRFEALAPTITLERETRTIRGKITAYGVPTSDYRRIVIHAGALRPRMPLSRVKLLIDHDQRQPVGFMTELDSDGLEAAFKVPEGEAGDKALSDAANGLRDGLSVGINVLDEDGAFTYDEESRTYNVYAAELVETSLCAIPAYQEAGVTNVAAAHQTAPTNTEQEQHTMTQTLTAEELEQRLSTERAEQERALEVRLAAFTPSPASSGPSYPSFGAFIKELAAGSDEALTFATHLAYGGATTADDYKRNTWIKDVIHLVESRRRIINKFTREPLPAEGMALEYAVLKSDTTKVAEQVAQGDDLVTGKVELDSKTTPVRTFGGYGEATIQTIKRANAAYLTTFFKAIAIKYAKATELAARKTLTDTIAAQITAGASLDLSATASTYDWLDLLVDASELYDDLGFELAGALVSKDVFKKLIRLEDTNGNSLMRVTGEGVNRVGTIDVKGLKGDLASVSFELLPGASANTATFYDPLAMTTWESAGAPFQLQQENVINLSEAFSLYGFLASAAELPAGIVPIEIATAP